MAPLDTTSRLSCLHSLGVLLRPCAAAVAVSSASSGPNLVGPDYPSRPADCSRDAPTVQLEGAEGGARRSPVTWNRDAKASSQPQLYAAVDSAEALASGERLFEKWMQGIFSELSLPPRREGGRKDSAAAQNGQPPDMSMHPIVRLAETLANCT